MLHCVNVCLYISFVPTQAGNEAMHFFIYCTWMEDYSGYSGLNCSLAKNRLKNWLPLIFQCSTWLTNRFSCEQIFLNVATCPQPTQWANDNTRCGKTDNTLQCSILRLDHSIKPWYQTEVSRFTHVEVDPLCKPRLNQFGREIPGNSPLHDHA